MIWECRQALIREERSGFEMGIERWCVSSFKGRSANGETDMAIVLWALLRIKASIFFSFFKGREWSWGAGKLPRGRVICSSVDSFWPLDVTYWSLLQRFLTNTRLEPDSAAQMLMVQGDIIGSCSTRFTQKSAIPQRGAICARDHWIGQDQSRSEIEAFSFKT